jgi:hypothetical protein
VKSLHPDGLELFRLSVEFDYMSDHSVSPSSRPTPPAMGDIQSVPGPGSEVVAVSLVKAR